MARHLARIHGTEEDKVNCPFYFKIGACRHADRCSRIHHRPAFSQTILIKHIYRHPTREAELQAAREGRSVDGVEVDQGKAREDFLVFFEDYFSELSKFGQLEALQSPELQAAREGRSVDGVEVDQGKAREDFLVFFEDYFSELSKFGQLEALHICDNLGDHMIGHVYAKFSEEEEAADALNVMNGRYYNGRKMEVEFSPVTDFREARCRDFDEDTCRRGGFCNFMHIKPVPICLIRDMEEDAEEERRREEIERMERRRKDDGRSRRRGERKGGERKRG
eukprot:CAMPEP_0201902352 /NCGR_PEP_ID=MMETSP0902-20130614/54911_1 /ASSEMBLY_ACC=CAM_ASM_000551 /TAXON_ID=420261 /ORGANISM="Thalassiosira antarctica, Strain CCMP982" /LENGTH=278 /DNA_ID=CAMNT_0048436351 /DNA_START=92 /DNA_END=926 /DNA_ORIENTATION=-